MIKNKVSKNVGGESPPQNGPAGNPALIFIEKNKQFFSSMIQNFNVYFFVCFYLILMTAFLKDVK